MGKTVESSTGKASTTDEKKKKTSLDRVSRLASFFVWTSSLSTKPAYNELLKQLVKTSIFVKTSKSLNLRHHRQENFLVIPDL